MRKKILCCLLIISIILPLNACGNKNATNNTPKPEATATKKPEFNIQEFEMLVADYNAALMNQVLLVANMAKYEANYWEALNNIGGSIDYDELVSYAEEWLDEKGKGTLEDLEKTHDEIGSQYSKIVKTNTDDSEAAILKDKSDELYSNYNLLYNLVTSPTGSLNNFVLSFEEYATKINSLSDEINTLL